MVKNRLIIGISLCALSLAGIAPAYAQKVTLEAMEPAERPSGAPATIGELAKRMRAPIHDSVVSVDWSTDSFVIPVAGNSSGSNGTYFRSDLAFNNDRQQSQTIAIGWLAQGQNNCNAALQYFTLSSNSITVADDFVGQTLHRSGIGAILVTAVTPGGAFDDLGEIDGYSRIWTRQPNANGTVSQNFTAIALTDSIGSLPATLMGLKQNSSYRTNVGVVNFDTVLHAWTFRSIFNSNVVTNVTVQPCSMTLTNAANGSGSASGNAAFTVTSDGFGFYWSGFGSSTDNLTGDGWVARAIQ
jgi:hypothetical protein